MASLWEDVVWGNVAFEMPNVVGGEKDSGKQFELLIMSYFLYSLTCAILPLIHC